MIRVFIDTNVFADVHLKRPEFIFDSSNFLYLCSSDTVKGFTSVISISNLFFILKKAEGNEETKRILSATLKLVDVLPVDDKMLSEALSGDFNDFEDAIQYRCALKYDMEYIITRNEKDFRKSEIPVLSPKKFIEKLIHK